MPSDERQILSRHRVPIVIHSGGLVGIHLDPDRLEVFKGLIRKRQQRAAFRFEAFVHRAVIFPTSNPVRPILLTALGQELVQFLEVFDLRQRHQEVGRAKLINPSAPPFSCPRPPACSTGPGRWSGCERTRTVAAPLAAYPAGSASPPA